MKKKIIYCLLILTSIVIQTSILPMVCQKCTLGDILLAFVLAGAILDGFGNFLGWAIFAGIMYDLASFSPAGVHSLIFLFITYFVSFFSRRFSVEIKGVGMVMFAAFVAAGTIFSRISMAFVNIGKPFSFDDFVKILGSPGELFLRIIVNIFLFIVCFILLKKIKKFYSLD